MPWIALASLAAASAASAGAPPRICPVERPAAFACQAGAKVIAVCGKGVGATYRRRAWLLAAVICLGIHSSSVAQTVQKAPGESEDQLARRALHLGKGAYPSITRAVWNGIPTVVVAYKEGGGDAETLRVVALMRTSATDYRRVDVTVGEEEGGAPDLYAIGFARAAHVGDRALLVLLKWPVIHAIAQGNLYEVRIFGFPNPEQKRLNLLRISKHFGEGCECWHADGPPGSKPYTTHFRYKTIAAIKAELHRLGY